MGATMRRAAILRNVCTRHLLVGVGSGTTAHMTLPTNCLQAGLQDA